MSRAGRGLNKINNKGLTSAPGCVILGLGI